MVFSQLRLPQEINSFVNLVRSNISEDKNFVNNVLLSFTQRFELSYDLEKKDREFPNDN